MDLVKHNYPDILLISHSKLISNSHFVDTSLHLFNQKEQNYDRTGYLSHSRGISDYPNGPNEYPQNSNALNESVAAHNNNNNSSYLNNRSYNANSYPNVAAGLGRYTKQKNNNQQNYSVVDPSSMDSNQQYQPVNNHSHLAQYGQMTNMSRIPSNVNSNPLYTTTYNANNNHTQQQAAHSPKLHLDQRLIYEKQQSRFNIISMLPKEHHETIKQYPKLTLENKPELMRIKMQQQANQYASNHYGTSQMNPSSSQTGNHNQFIAGKQTYALTNGTQLDNTSAQPQSYQPADLSSRNRSSSYGVPNQSSNPNQPNGYAFRAKMLNHADEFKGIM